MKEEENNVKTEDNNELGVEAIEKDKTRSRIYVNYASRISLISCVFVSTRLKSILACVGVW